MGLRLFFPALKKRTLTGVIFLAGQNLIPEAWRWARNASQPQSCAIVGSAAAQKSTTIQAQIKMTQEFVAEALSVSRQAVSKWKSGTANPSTTNLMAPAKLFDAAAEDLLKETRT